jgi:hypothetical protein
MSKKPKDPNALLRPLEGIEHDLDAEEKLSDIETEEKTSDEQPSERAVEGHSGVGERIIQEGPRISVTHLTVAELAEISPLAALRHKSGRGFEQAGRSAVDSLIGGVAPDTRPVCALHNIVGCQCLDSEEIVAERAERNANLVARANTDPLSHSLSKERRQIIELRAYGYAAYNRVADEMEAEIEALLHPKIKTETDIIADAVAAKLEARGAFKPNAKITKRCPRLKNIFTDKTKNLRDEFRYDVRQVARLLDHPEFNKLIQVRDPNFVNSKNMKRWKYEIEHGKGQTRYETETIKEFTSPIESRVEIIDGVAHVTRVAALAPADQRAVNSTQKVLVRPGTMDEWYAMRNGAQLVKLPFIEPHDAAFYRAYANRNLSPDEMRAQFGQVEEDSIIALENRIIKHALHLGLLRPPLEVAAAMVKRREQNEFERGLDESWQMETRSIGKHISWGAIGGTTGGRTLAELGGMDLFHGTLCRRLDYKGARNARAYATVLRRPLVV